MTNVERAVQKFRDSSSPVIMTSAEHLALCSFYGAIRPNDYDNPFMGKVIEIREREFEMPSEAYEPEIEDTFIPEDESEDTFLRAPVDELDGEQVESAYDETEVPEEDPYA